MVRAEINGTIQKEQRKAIKPKIGKSNKIGKAFPKLGEKRKTQITKVRNEGTLLLTL